MFFQTTFGAVVSVAGLGYAIGADVLRLLDVATIGIGVFLVFGRIGCFHVACCHGRPSARGVIYGPGHVAVGLWPRWSGRPLIPVQLIESAGSLLLVIVALLLSEVSGTATLVYALGYTNLRFGLELWRGDPVRPFALGLSEAQWWCLATAVLCVIVLPSIWTIATAGVIGASAIALVATRRSRELVQPPHLHELDSVCERILADPAHARRDTGLGVGASLHVLPDGRRDWVLSSQHPAWSAAMARRIASLLWREAEIVEGRTPGVVHVVEPNTRN